MKPWSSVSLALLLSVPIGGAAAARNTLGDGCGAEDRACYWSQANYLLDVFADCLDVSPSAVPACRSDDNACQWSGLNSKMRAIRPAMSGVSSREPVGTFIDACAEKPADCDITKRVAGFSTLAGFAAVSTQKQTERCRQLKADPTSISLPAGGSKPGLPAASPQSGTLSVWLAENPWVIVALLVMVAVSLYLVAWRLWRDRRQSLPPAEPHPGVPPPSLDQEAAPSAMRSEAPPPAATGGASMTQSFVPVRTGHQQPSANLAPRFALDLSARSTPSPEQNLTPAPVKPISEIVQRDAPSTRPPAAATVPLSPPELTETELEALTSPEDTPETEPATVQREPTPTQESPPPGAPAIGPDEPVDESPEQKETGEDREEHSAFYSEKEQDDFDEEDESYEYEDQDEDLEQEEENEEDYHEDDDNKIIPDVLTNTAVNAEIDAWLTDLEVSPEQRDDLFGAIDDEIISGNYNALISPTARRLAAAFALVDFFRLEVFSASNAQLKTTALVGKLLGDPQTILWPATGSRFHPGRHDAEEDPPAPKVLECLRPGLAPANGGVFPALVRTA